MVINMRFVSLFFLLFLSLYSYFVFAQPAPGSGGGGANPQPMCGQTISNTCIYNAYLGSQFAACINNLKGLVVQSDKSCQSDQSPFSCKKDCSCPEGFTLTTDGIGLTTCMPEVEEPSDCEAPNVKNIETGACEAKAECVYPLLYDSFSNTCRNNPNNCAIGCTANPLSPGDCMCSGTPECPSPDWALTATGTSCYPTGTASSTAASAPQTSSTPNTSAPSSSGSGGGDPQNPGTGGGDDDNGGGTGNNNSASASSYSGTGGGGAGASSAPNTGYGNWIPVAENSPCPNKYKDINGQWWCSGSNGSSAGSGAGGNDDDGAGDCDPTAADYLICAGLLEEIDGDDLQDLLDGMDEGTNDAKEDADKLVEDDLKDFERDGVPFAEEPSAIRGALTSLLPVSSGCSPPSITFFNRTKTLPCTYFNVFKQALGWFLAIVTAWQVWQLAIRPVER